MTGPDPAVLEDAIRQVLVDRDRQAAAAATEALAVGGPCRMCGITRSWTHDQTCDQDVGRWYPGPTCAWCHGDEYGLDAERRDRLLRRTLTREQLGGWGMGAAERAGLRWWHEVSGAPTSQTRRFAYLDVDAMAARLAPDPPRYTTREPCHHGGCPDLWRQGETYAPGGARVTTWTCCGCARITDLGLLISWATGLTPAVIDSLGMAGTQVLGVDWWVAHPAGGAATPPRPGAPFAYLDRVAARRRAYEVFGGGDWAQLRFASPAAYDAARVAAQ